MKVCTRCFMEFDEEEDLYVDPAEDIGDILSHIGVDDINDICPECREELGVAICLGVVANHGYVTDED